MFNNPRRTTPSLAQSAFLNSSAASPYSDPLASSTPNPGSAAAGAYGEVDPWSGIPSPTRSGTPRRESDDDVLLPGAQAEVAGYRVDGRTGGDGLNGFLSDPPALYLSLLDQMDKTPMGEVSLASVHRLLSSSKLPAATVERIVNLTSRERSSFARSEFICALAFVALAQSASSDPDDITIDRLTAVLPDLPLPALSVPAPSSSPAPASAFRPERPASSPSYLSASPWDTPPRQPRSPSPGTDYHAPNGINGSASASASASATAHVNEATDYSVGSGSTVDVANPAADAERGYWKRLEKVDVELIKEKEGWFLQKYQVTSDKRGGLTVSRRYSDFVWLLDCILKRYPFRILPTLPPKKISPDAVFLEQRRKGLQRFINMIVNHPILREDGALNVFLTEPNFEAWRKRVKVSSEEESASKKLSRVEELNLPADLDEKLGILRDHLPALLGSYQKLVLLAERSLARLLAAAADSSRFALGLHTVAEEMPRCCFRAGGSGGGSGAGCSLCSGVGRGLGEVAESWTRVAEEGERRAAAILLNSIEALKTQRDLYLAFRDLFIRHDRLSKDTVDSLRKKVDTRLKKIDQLKISAKPNWEVEVDKLVSGNDQDKSQIESLLSRRVFNRACMWHELSVVFHSRQAAQATLGWRAFAKAEQEACVGLAGIWQGLGERLERMPVE